MVSRVLYDDNDWEDMTREEVDEVLTEEEYVHPHIGIIEQIAADDNLSLDAGAVVQNLHRQKL